MSNTYGYNWGIRLFTFSPSEKGYYLSLSVKNQIWKKFFEAQGQFRKKYPNGFEVEAEVDYSNYFDSYFGEGMDTKYSDQVFLYSNQFELRQKIVKKQKNYIFYGVQGQIIFRKEIPSGVEGEKRIPTELLVVGKALAGHDSRDHWSNTKTGQYHTVSAGCVPSLGYGSSFCSFELDLRSYFEIYKKVRLALRGFTGTTLLAPATYSLAYRLGGTDVLRGFTDNRFRGDKIYFVQTELRGDLWKEIVSGAVFAELGEVASFDKKFTNPRWNYGLGLRFGIPPSYNMKVRMDLGFSTDKKDKRKFNFIVDFHQAF